MNPLQRLLHVPSADWGNREIRVALRGIAQPDAVKVLEEEARRALGVEVVAFGSGRAALAAVLLALPLEGHRIHVPAYTCVAVPNAIRTAELEASWVDIVGPNIDTAAALEASGAGDAILAQHTYGVACDRDGLQAIQRAGRFVVEDRAHRFDGAALVGDGAIWSLEHSKVISAGQGGLAWARNAPAFRRLRDLQTTWAATPEAAARQVLWTSASQLLIARAGRRVEPLASLLRRVALRAGPISIPAQSEDEMHGGSVALLGPHPMLATVGASALRQVGTVLDHRRDIARIYRSRLAHLVPDWAKADIPYLRQPILVEDAEATTRALRSAGIDLGRRWFDSPIHPHGSISTYLPGGAPEAERLSVRVLSLPTHPMIDRATAVSIAAHVLAAAG